MNPDANMAQLKVLLDPLLGGLFEDRRKNNPNIFEMTKKIERLFFVPILEMLLHSNCLRVAYLMGECLSVRWVID
jgi:hypothetical protein